MYNRRSSQHKVKKNIKTYNWEGKLNPFIGNMICIETPKGYK